jgi:hypothetical protein
MILDLIMVIKFCGEFQLIAPTDAKIKELINLLK